MSVVLVPENSLEFVADIATVQNEGFRQNPVFSQFVLNHWAKKGMINIQLFSDVYSLWLIDKSRL